MTSSLVRFERRRRRKGGWWETSFQTRTKRKAQRAPLFITDANQLIRESAQSFVPLITLAGNEEKKSLFAYQSLKIVRVERERKR